jgi:hypothetical protein
VIVGSPLQLRRQVRLLHQPLRVVVSVLVAGSEPGSQITSGDGVAEVERDGQLAPADDILSGLRIGEI